MAKLNQENLAAYMGTQKLFGLPMTRAEYNNYRGWETPEDEKGTDKGFLVEYVDNNSNHPDHTGYITWMLKDVFLDTFRRNGDLSFGQALLGVTEGLKMCRESWRNAEYITYMPGYPDGIEVNNLTQLAHNLPKGTILKYAPYFQKYTKDGLVVMWTPSTEEVLANDWKVIS